jgi:hypothetical protein
MVVKIKKRQINAILYIVIYSLAALSAFAQGDLMINPKRVVFDENNRIQEINLANTSNDTAVYGISFVQYRMNESGGFENITEPDSGQRFASTFLRMFPRKVILAPRESQTIKVQLTKTSEIQTGEYRSHIYFRSLKETKPLGETPGDSNTIRIRIEPVIGITIPCIIRKGETSVSLSITGLGYENIGDTLFYLKMNLNRTGNISSFGDIFVNYIDVNNNSYEVGVTKGLAVYTPSEIRKCRIMLKKPEGISFVGGKFRVVYSSREGNKLTVFAEAEMILKN